MSRLRIGIALAAAGLALAGADAAFAHGPAKKGPPESSTAKAARGLVYDGLQRGRAGGPCGTDFLMRLPSGRLACTHGPDPAPTVVDVRRQRSVAELSRTTSSARVPCIGDGSSGNRVLAIYAFAAGRTSRYAKVAPLIRHWAADLDRVFTRSAAETDGVRHVRFVTDDDCKLVVRKVRLSARADDSFWAMASELEQLGYASPDRKYLVWMDANVYCGLGQRYPDDRPGQENYNNGHPAIPGMYARIDNGCWGMLSSWLSVEAHELVHTLGGVQDSAPNSSGHGHCTDDGDTMCYADSPSVTVRAVCSDAHEKLLDCKHNDYYSTRPPDGSYLDRRWNVARSSFLSTQAPDHVDPTVNAPTQTVEGDVDTDSVPVRLRWSGRDSRSGIARYRLLVAIDGSRLVGVDLPSRKTRAVTVALEPGHAYRFAVRAVDGAGNRSRLAYGPRFAVKLHPGGSEPIAESESGDEVALGFTGRNVAWAAPTGPGGGEASIFVDGAYVGAVSLHSEAPRSGRVLFTRRWSSSGAHTLVVRTNDGTPLASDALVVLR